MVVRACGGSPRGSSMVKRAPPPGRVSPVMRPPCASTIARQIARPRPTPGVALSLRPRSNIWKIASSRCLGRPGPWSSTNTLTRSPAAAALISIGVPGGVYLPAFSSRLHSTRSNSAASMCSKRQVRRAASTRTRRASSVPSMARKALPIASSSGSHCRFSCTWPDCRRAMSSRLLTCELMRSAASRIEPRELGLPAVAGRLRHRQRVGHADQRGQRRAQVVRDRGEQRVAQALRLHLHRRALRHVHVVDALQRDRQQRRAGVEQAALLGPGQARRVARLDRQHAAHAHRRLQRQVEDGRGRQVLVPWPAASSWSKAHCAMPGSMPDGSVGRGHRRRQPVLQVGHQQRRRCASNSDFRKRAAISAICSAISAPDRSRDIS